jgi:hypothetical protein
LLRKYERELKKLRGRVLTTLIVQWSPSLACDCCDCF